MVSSVWGLLLGLGFGSLVLTLISVIALLSIFRQKRAQRTAPHSHATQPLPTVEISEMDTVAEETQPVKIVEKPAPTVKPRFVPEPEHLRLPVREGTPDQVVIQIDAPEGPSRAQANVQRIIAYLKADQPEASEQANAS